MPVDNSWGDVSDQNEKEVSGNSDTSKNEHKIHWCLEGSYDV